jgi:hypothetical protein
MSEPLPRPTALQAAIDFINRTQGGIRVPLRASPEAQEFRERGFANQQARTMEGREALGKARIEKKEQAAARETAMAEQKKQDESQNKAFAEETGVREEVWASMTPEEKNKLAGKLIGEKGKQEYTGERMKDVETVKHTFRTERDAKLFENDKAMVDKQLEADIAKLKESGEITKARELEVQADLYQKRGEELEKDGRIDQANAYYKESLVRSRQIIKEERDNAGKIETTKTSVGGEAPAPSGRTQEADLNGDGKVSPEEQVRSNKMRAIQKKLLDTPDMNPAARQAYLDELANLKKIGTIK